MCKIYKFIIVTVLSLLYIGCIISSTYNNLDIKQSEIQAYHRTGEISLKIMNNITNSKLTINNCSVNNIYNDNDYINIEFINDNCVLIYGEVIMTKSHKITPQFIKKWTPVYKPNFETHVILNCEIEINQHLIYKGNIYIPISGNIYENKRNVINLTMESGCPWYEEVNGVLHRILVPITFNPSVSDWQTFEDITIEL